MYSWEWICVPLVICNLFIFTPKNFAQSTYVIDSLQLSKISQEAYLSLKDIHRQDISEALNRFDSLIHLRNSLEKDSNIRSRMLAHRLQIIIDQALLFFVVHRSSFLSYYHSPNDSLSLEQLLFENASGNLTTYNNHDQLQEATGLSDEWIYEEYLYPTPMSEVKMIKMLLVSKLHQEAKAAIIREIINQYLEGENTSEIKNCLLIQKKHLPSYSQNELGQQEYSFDQLYQINIFHLLCPFLGDKTLIENELRELYQTSEAQPKVYTNEQIESISTLSGCWLTAYEKENPSRRQVELLLYAFPFTERWEDEVSHILIEKDTILFPYYADLLGQTNNRLILSRIIHILTQVSGDKSEIIPLVRAKLFELYFLYKGKFLSSEQLIQEFGSMSLQEGGDLMILLLGDGDQRIRVGALKRLAEIGDSYTYKKLKKILLDIEYTPGKKTIKEAENSLHTIYSRIIPPDPLEISLPSPNLEGSKPHLYAIVADEMPQFPGGIDALKRYLQKKSKYIRKHPLEGIVMLRFTVDTNGHPTDIQIVKSLHPLYDQRAIDIVEAMPKWKTGYTKGKPVAVSQHLTIAFRL